jgi:hypothetical protein
MAYEIGKRYYRQDGKVTGVLEKNTKEPTPTYPLYDPLHSEYYGANGNYWGSGSPSTADLTTEYIEQTDPSTAPTVPPRDGFRYKMRNGTVTQRMQKCPNKDTVFTTLSIDRFGDLSRLTWNSMGRLRSEHTDQYDLIAEMPIEWGDFEVVSDLYNGALTLVFQNTAVSFAALDQYKMCINVHVDNRTVRVATTKAEALAYIRTHFARPTETDRIATERADQIKSTANTPPTTPRLADKLAKDMTVRELIAKDMMQALVGDRHMADVATDILAISAIQYTTALLNALEGSDDDGNI